MLSSLIPFRRHHSVRPLDPSAIRCLQPQERFHALVFRERARADRNGRAFTLASFQLPRSAAGQRNLLRLAHIAMDRSRLTDDVGWFDSHMIAALLPETTTQGAWVYAQGVAEAFEAKFGAFPEVKIYTYPTNWVDRSPRTEAEAPAVATVKGHASVPADEPMPHPVMALSLERLFLRPIPLVKRAIDLVGATLGFVLLSPVLIAAAVAVKATSPGPVFFSQKRAGLGGEPFVMYKFRSMHTDAEKRKADLAHLNEQDGPAFKMKNDPRITKIGRFIRKASIDELPQLINVLKGEMSLVGPRPPTFDEVAKYEAWYRRRLEVTPGLTCIWQVYGRSKVSFEDWMRMDARYVHSRNLWGDLKLLVNTIPAVLFGKGAC